MKKLITYGAIILSSIFGGKSSAQEVWYDLKPPQINLVPDIVSKKELETQTPSFKIINVNASPDPVQNAANLETASRDPFPGTLVVRPKNGVYGDGYTHIRLNSRSNIHYAPYSNRSPIPTRALELQNRPTTGVFIASMPEFSPNGSSTTLDRLIFYSGMPAPDHFLDFKVNDIKVRDCLFIGSGNSKAIELPSSAGITSLTITGCIFTSFTWGVQIDELNSVWRRNIFMNNEYGFYGNAGADLGTLESPGDNLFLRNQYSAWIAGGSGYPLRWGYFYDRSGTRQLRTLSDIIATFRDDRTTSPTFYPQSIGSDILLVPFHTDPHPLVPYSAGVPRWTDYK